MNPHCIPLIFTPPRCHQRFTWSRQLQLTHILCCDHDATRSECTYRVDRAELERQSQSRYCLKVLTYILTSNHKFALNLKNLHAELHSAKQRYEKKVLIVKILEIADVWWKSIATTFSQGKTKCTLASCMLALMLLTCCVSVLVSGDFCRFKLVLPVMAKQA